MTLILLALLACKGDDDANADDSSVTDDSSAPLTEDCEDGVDNDDDGDIDCDDVDCDDDEACEETATETDCADGVDNDDDGATDCDDSDCQTETSCQDEDCTDGADNDDDGLIDCYDTECVGTDSCIEDCTDGEDNDVDGLTDCYDTECVGTDSCIEDCVDGLDNDVDGLVDCEDGDCAAELFCYESDCFDEVDNDDDGATDCDDDECWVDDACVRGQAQVTSGRMVWGVDYSSVTRFPADESRPSSYYTGGIWADITSIAGTLVLDRGTFTSTCAFGVAAARVEANIYPSYTLYSPNPVVRSGWTTSGACGGVGSHVLPNSLRFDISAYAMALPGTGNPIWYAGQPFTYYNSGGTTTYWSTSASGDVFRRERYGVTVGLGSLNSGDSYSFVGITE